MLTETSRIMSDHILDHFVAQASGHVKSTITLFPGCMVTWPSDGPSEPSRPSGFSFGPGGTKTRDSFHRNWPLDCNMPKTRVPFGPADSGPGSFSEGVLGLVGCWTVSLPPSMLGALQAVMATDVPRRCPVSPGGDRTTLSENSKTVQLIPPLAALVFHF